MPAIEDYAFLGDTHSAALVSREGSIDWLCLPRFDSPSCFAALLDPDAGHWAIAPDCEVARVTRCYRDETLVLETIFETLEGAVKLVDFLALEEQSDPSEPGDARPEEVLVRVVEGLSGSVPMRMEYAPRFGYGEIFPWLREQHGIIEAVGGPDALDLAGGADLTLEKGLATADFTVSQGDQVPFIASYHPSHIDSDPPRLDEWPELLLLTERFWRGWADRCHHQSPRRDLFIRSLLTLKALTFCPSGGLVAAATTSLPEQIGGPRNWDYRYCWLRDATFTLEVMLQQGYTKEAQAWRDWLLRAVAGDPEDMQIMYGVLGERRLQEWELPWLSGYERSRPVRVGNAATEQFQLDVYGEVMDSFHSARRAGLDTSEHAWGIEKVIADFVCDHWREPDEGIWEVRSGRRHFVHSKVMAWVAIDRAAKAVEMFGQEGPAEHWREVCREIRSEVMDRGISESRRCFKRAYDEDELDASLLVLPLVGFVDATDPIMVATIDAIQEELVVDGFVSRYASDVVDDGLPPGEGTFLMCSFWLVNCLVLMGRLEAAEELFERCTGVANDLGLLSEQFDPQAGRLLGNFPQAFSHVALVTSGMALQTAGKTSAIKRGA